MDESAVRAHAEAHGRAVVEREYERAMEDLSDEVKATATEVMRELPRPVTSASVERVALAGDEVLAYILYEGDDAATTVESRWADVDGRPRIVQLSVVDKR